MPSTAVIAGGVAAVLICAGLGIGLGVGLTRDDNDSVPPPPNTHMALKSVKQGPPADATDQGVSQESGAAGGADAPPVIGSPLAAGPRGPPGSFPGTAPAAIVPMPEPMLGPVEVPVVAPTVVAPLLAPVLAPGPGPMEVPITGPGIAPMFAPGPGPEEFMPGPAPEDFAPGPAPEEFVPGPAPEEFVPGPAPLDEDITPLAEIPVLVAAPVPAPEEVLVGTFVDRVAPGPDGRYPVCINGDSEQWGEWNSFRPCGVRVFADGRVELAEWFGGFDGYPAVDPADGHETCFNTAVVEMFGLPLCDFERTTDGFNDYGEEIEAVECLENDDGTQCACTADEKKPSLKSQRKWPGNVGVINFLTEMRARADPVNYDFPEDEEIADAGGRADNVVLVQAVFEDMISVSQC